MAQFKLTPIKKSDCFLEPLFAEFPDLLQTPRSFDTKSMQTAELLSREIAAGTFLQCHQFNPLWSRRVGLDKITMTVSTRPELLDKYRKALEQVRLKVSRGSWYPPVKDGKRTKISFAHFLLEKRAVGYASPFLEYYMASLQTPELTIEQCREELGPKVSAIVDIIQSKRSRPETARLWSGAIDLLDWWCALPEEVINGSQESQLLLSKASMLFHAVQDFQNNGGWIPDTFVNPMSPAWGQFKDWIQRARKVRLP